jgi:RNA polymerase sigma-70 factor (ECF subfamily)
MKNWTGRIMRNSFISGYHRLRREPNVDDEVAAMSVQVAPSQEWAVRSNELRAALDQLPSTNRDAVIRVAMGHSYNDVAASLGCELGTVKSRVSRARHSLTVALGNASNHDAYSACL